MKYKITRIREGRRIRKNGAPERVVVVKFETETGYRGMLEFNAKTFTANKVKETIEKHVMEISKLTEIEGEK